MVWQNKESSIKHFQVYKWIPYYQEHPENNWTSSREQGYNIFSYMVQFTSSTRMELGVIQRALHQLSQLAVDQQMVIFATDSMTVLSKIQAGYLPSKWLDFRVLHPSLRVVWTYVLGMQGWPSISVWISMPLVLVSLPPRASPSRHQAQWLPLHEDGYS